ncbi:hypothetical protein GOB76_09945 [Acetobacter peroxydans]|nr:hypothetical protein [Acetobacter peroxydans]
MIRYVNRNLSSSRNRAQKKLWLEAKLVKPGQVLARAGFSELMTDRRSTIAYLVMAHAINDQLKLLIDSLLSDPRARLYIHIDAKVTDIGRLPADADQVKVLTDRTIVNWGGFSVVEATLALLNVALLDKENERFVLLSGSCFPLRDPVTVGDAILAQDKPSFAVWGRIDPSLAENENLGRYVVTKYHPFDIQKINPKNNGVNAFLWNIFKIINNKAPYERKIEIDDLWKGSQFFLIQRDIAISFVKPCKKLVHALRFAMAPDEIFFTTLYVRWAKQRNIPVSLTDPKTENQNIHYIRKRNSRSRPLLHRLFVPIDLRILDRKDIDAAVESGALFARKCSFEVSQKIKSFWNDKAA